MDYCIISNTFCFSTYFYCMFGLRFCVSTLWTVWLLAFAFVYVATDFLVFIVVLLRIPNPQPNRRILPKSV